MARVYVEVDLYEFDDNDLIEELEDRGYTIEKDNEEEDDEVSEPSKNRLPSSYTIKRCADAKPISNTVYLRIQKEKEKK